MAALGFALSDIFVRRASRTASPLGGARLTVFIGPPIFAVIAFAVGELRELLTLPWTAYLFFAGAGLVQFIIGRSLFFLAISTIGASRASVILALAPVFSLALAIPLFGESIGLPVILGGSLIMLGPVLITMGRQQEREFDRVETVILGGTVVSFKQGVMLAIGASFAWGTSPVLVKAGLDAADFPVLGTFIAYSMASLALGFVYTSAEPRRELIQMDRRGLSWYVFAGLANMVAQLSIYLALIDGAVTLFVLLMRSSPLFVLLLTFLVNRHVERLNGPIVAGCVLVVLGGATIGLWGR